MQIETILLPNIQRMEYWQEQWLTLFREQTNTDLAGSYQWLANDFINLKKGNKRRCYIVHSDGVFKGAIVCEPEWYKLGKRLPLPIVNTGSHFVNDFAIDNIDSHNALTALINAIQNDFPHSAWIHFERLTLNCLQHIQSLSTKTHASVLSHETDHSAVFDVSSGDFLTFSQSMSSKSKANLRNYERLLGKKVGTVVHEIISPHPEEDIDIHFNQFLAIENSGWKGQKGTAITQLTGSKNFHYSLCKTAAKQGQLRWYKLYAGDQLVTINMAIQRAGNLWIVKTAYDDNYRKFSPGVIGITKLLGSAIEDEEICKVRMITNYSWLDRWHPTEEAYHGARIFNRNLLGKLFYAFLKFMQGK
jgi:hypothetical protein